jgi:hypothetical protein
MRFAILGAGGAGVCAALELAVRGYPVDLYDENALPVCRASWVNEGKIHLGLLYAKDDTQRTTQTMIAGALEFLATLKRWIDIEPGRDPCVLSSTFHYAVHRNTMVPVDDLKRHYAQCARVFDDMHQSIGHRYLGLDSSIVVEELSRRELESLVNADHFLTAFRTNERSIDPRPLAAALRAAVAGEPRIHFVGGARVRNVRKAQGERLSVSFERDGEVRHELYDQVANTLWHGRLEIDASLGITYDRPWLHRYKLGNRVMVPLPADSPPSITCVLGPFGDIVNFGRQGLFLSWYPIGMCATSQALRPPEWELDLSAEARHDRFRRSHAHWLELCPSLASVAFSPESVDPTGGVIFSWGETDIDDERSELHERYEIGLYSVGGYHTVNTGKFTMAPLFGLKTAERMLGLA